MKKSNKYPGLKTFFDKSSSELHTPIPPWRPTLPPSSCPLLFDRLDMTYKSSKKRIIKRLTPIWKLVISPKPDISPYTLPGPFLGPPLLPSHRTNPIPSNTHSYLVPSSSAGSSPPTSIYNLGSNPRFSLQERQFVFEAEVPLETRELDEFQAEIRMCDQGVLVRSHSVRGSISRLDSASEAKKNKVRRETWDAARFDRDWPPLHLASSPEDLPENTRNLLPIFASHIQTPTPISPTPPELRCPPPEAPFTAHLKYHQSHLSHLYTLYTLLLLLQATLYTYNAISINILSAIALPLDITARYTGVMDEWWIEESRWINNAVRRVCWRWEMRIRDWGWCFQRSGGGETPQQMRKALKGLIRSFKGATDKLLDGQAGGKNEGHNQGLPNWMEELLRVPFTCADLERDVAALEESGEMEFGSLTRLQKVRGKPLSEVVFEPLNSSLEDKGRTVEGGTEGGEKVSRGEKR